MIMTMRLRYMRDKAIVSAVLPWLQAAAMFSFCFCALLWATVTISRIRPTPETRRADVCRYAGRLFAQRAVASYISRPDLTREEATTFWLGGCTFLTMINGFGAATSTFDPVTADWKVELDAN